MKINRMTVVTLGVADLQRATNFYREVLTVSPNTSHGSVTFFEMQGVWLSLYPLVELAKDIAPNVPAEPVPFGGFTLAHNARSKDEVTAILSRVEAHGGRIAKAAADTFWGGFGGYFADPDGHYWEVVYGDMFEFDAQGGLLPSREVK